MTTTEQAQKAVGNDAQTDWELRPRAHANDLAKEAGPLERVLSRPDMEEIIDTFEVSNKAANRARDRYKRLMGLSALASFGAMLIAAGLLLVYASKLDVAPTLTTSFTVAQGCLLLISLLLSIVVARGRPFDIWMRERATAEHERILLFNRVFAAQEPHTAGELPYLPLKLEYFRRYQLDVQRKYYLERGKEHARAVTRSTLLRWFGTLLVLAAALPVISTTVNFDLDTWLRGLGLPAWTTDSDFQQHSFIAVNTIGAALQGFLAAFSLINQDERNAARYAATSENLEALATRPLDEARAAAAQDDERAVETFVALVQEQISSEHREWISLRAIAPNLSLGQLRQLTLPWLR